MKICKTYKTLLVTLFLIAFIAGCGDGSGGGSSSSSSGGSGDGTAPTVTSTNPANGATNVPLNKRVAAVFSEAMNPLTVNAALNTPAPAFQITAPGNISIAGTTSLDAAGINAVFTPTVNFIPNTVLTATITTAAQDVAGTPLAVSAVWTFTTGTTTDTTAPTVLSTNPANAATGVPLNATVAATFSEAMDPTTITSTSYTVTGPGSTSVAGTVSYDLVNNVANFIASSNLAANTTFTATITTAARDLADNALAANKVWTFTTGTQTAQVGSQSSVPLGSSSNFAILASAAITNIPTSLITGDVGLTPDTGANITGFSSPATCPEVVGIMYKVDAAGPACAQINPTLLSAAKTDAQIAFTNANAAVRGTPQAISGNLNGLTLYPGLYESGTTIEISAGGFLYLDALGDVDAVFIIRSATSITTLSASEVVLAGGAKATNVYWTAGSAVTLGTNSIMKGTIIAGTAITLQTGANLQGRALNQGPSAAAITLDSSVITVPSP